MALHVRGGSDVDASDAEDDELVVVSGSLPQLIGTIAYRIVTILIATISIIVRAVLKVLGVGNDMELEPDGAVDGEGHGEQVMSAKDFGGKLSATFSVEQSRLDLENPTPIVSGAFLDALKLARSQARLLFVFVPSVPTRKSVQSGPDKVAAASFLSADVSSVSEKKSLRGVNDGSYLLYSSSAESSETQSLIKILKPQVKNASGKKIPLLLVACLAQSADKYGMPRLVPKLLAQHHASPPPTAEKMAAWLNALRKRQKKRYEKMHEDIKEMEFYKERKAGYKESIQDDNERKERERLEAEKKREEEEAEMARIEAVKARRIIFLENIADEPIEEDATTTISFRFTDGKSGQRRFRNDQSLEFVLNWLDATFEVERELLVLTTMNGRSSFTWRDRDTVMGDTKLPRKAALRVTIIEKTEAQAVENE